MERRYIVVGLSILVASAIFIAYGIAVASGQIIGAALSTVVVGMVFLSFGATYREPIEDLLKHYTSDIHLFTSRVIEDMGIVGGSRIRLCLEKSILIYSEKPIDCSSDTLIGAGILDDVPYVAIPISNTATWISRFIDIGGDIGENLRTLVGRMSRAISVHIEGDAVEIELEGLTEAVREVMRYPVNIVRIAILATVAVSYGTDVEIAEESMATDSYRVKLRVERG